MARGELEQSLIKIEDKALEAKMTENTLEGI